MVFLNKKLKNLIMKIIKRHLKNLIMKTWFSETKNSKTNIIIRKRTYQTKQHLNNYFNIFSFILVFLSRLVLPFPFSAKYNQRVVFSTLCIWFSHNFAIFALSISLINTPSLYVFEHPFLSL